METTLGQLITNPANRDAIHVAVAPVVCGEFTLQPCQHVGFLKDGTVGQEQDCETIVGIVDPFLREPVLTGQSFWLVLYPKSVTNLRHHWSHPAFQDPSEPSKEAAIAWITTFAARWPFTYEEMMAGAHAYIKNNSQLDDDWKQLDIETEEWSEFWKHFTIITGLKLDNRDPEFITCCP